MVNRKRSSTARGYGYQHQRLRKRWTARIAQGGVTCWRCGTPINPGDDWDLGHDDHDRTRYRGAECRRCNRATSGRRSQPHSRAW